MSDDAILSIDQNKLDREWTDQPKRFYDYAIKLADARADQERSKVELDLAVAELDQAIRQEPERFGIEKITEAAVKNAILMTPRYAKYMKKVIAAKHRVDVLQAAVTALDHRKRALEKLVDLHGQNYFSEPRAKGENRQAMDAVERKAARSKVKLPQRRKAEAT